MPVPGMKRRLTTFTPIAIAAIMLALVGMPGAASAQDPGVDEYTPTAPGAGGPTPQPGNPAGSASGLQTGAVPSAGDPATDPSQDAASSADEEATTTQTRGESKNKDQRTLDGIVASARDQREQVTGPDDSDQVATRLLRSDDDGGGGMGVVLWILVGGTVLWGIATLFSRRHQSGKLA